MVRSSIYTRLSVQLGRGVEVGGELVTGGRLVAFWIPLDKAGFARVGGRYRLGAFVDWLADSIIKLHPLIARRIIRFTQHLTVLAI
jgi:hypothetical protein